MAVNENIVLKSEVSAGLYGLQIAGDARRFSTAVPLSTPSSTRTPCRWVIPPTIFHRLTDETGGILFDPPGADYSGIISRIEADLRGHYILGFRPEATSSDTQHHSLKVEVRRAGATARARREYSGP